MARAITVAILAAALALVAPLAAQAAGLGKLTVLSPLGQPLNAEIEIVALRPGEEDGLTARIAPLEAFQAAGIEPSVALNSVRFSVERRDSRRILRVTSTQPMNEPFVELLVELQWQTGRLVREYTFLLDPPEYKARELALAPAKPAAPPLKPAEPAPAAPAAPPALTPEPTPTPQVEVKPMDPAPAPPVAAAPPPPAAEPAKEAAKEEPAKEEPVKEERAKPQAAKEESAKPAAAGQDPKVHEVMKGDTLGKIARDNLPPGVTLNQMLVAIYRANQDAFIRENVNLVRAGRILNIPSPEGVGTVDVEEANRIVRSHMAEFREYRSRLAAAPATADAAIGQRDSAGPIEPKPEAPKPPAAQDQVRLSKADPQKPSAPGAAAAARGDDLAARERALKEAQSRISDLEKNVADLQKLLELKNQQLAELERKAGSKPAPAPAAKPPEKPVAEAPKPAPAAEAPKPAPAPAPLAKAPDAPKPPAPAAKPAAKPVAAPPPEPSLLDEFLDNPVALAGLAAVLILLLVYALVAWRKKKTAQAKFTDSVIGAAAAGAAAGASISEPTLGSASTPASQSTVSAPPAAGAAEEVDPIAEADVYMAYGRDAQAEEILKEALQKDSSRVAVHAKLLEIYAKRRDTTAYEQTAVKLKSLTNGTGPEWDKAAALGKSIDPNNGLYAGAAAGAAFVVPAAASMSAPSAPTLDFDIGGVPQPSGSAPDLNLDAPAPKPADTGLDFDVSGAGDKKEPSPDETIVQPATSDKDGGLDFNLDLGSAAPAAEPEKKPAPALADAGLDFDLNLGGEKEADAPAAPDLSTISLDLGSSDAAASSPTSGSDPKWQEIATKLDLAKAYEEMGDKDGARELLNEVMKDGDPAQKGQAQQLLAKLS